jgi:hypothetical protein
MADRLPPGQGALQNWNNINSNKPEEYSSEFTVDGNKFANVTNVSTGQRQLYFVQPLSNQRGLLTTTNADGTITKGDKYDNFNQFNSGKLAAAETANKQASVKLLSTPGVSTPAESAAIKNSKEFKSTSVGNNAATNSPTPPSQAASPATPEQAASAASDSFKAGTRKKYESLRYPENLSLETQDVIKFTILQYKPSLAGGQTGQTGRIVDLKGIVAGTTVLGSITLPIPAGINDGNSVGWSMDEMNDLQEAAGKTAALLLESQNIEAGVKPLENLAKDVATPEGKSGISGMIANLATNANIMKRSQGATINNNQELLFGGPSLRNFSFVFSFYPRSKTEAIIVRKIIRTFKQSMSVKRSETSLLLKSPHTFAISYLTAGQKAHPYLNRFKECALTSCNIDYTPDGTYMTYGGDEKSMTAYRMTLSFSELEPIFDDEYGESDYDNIGF